MGAAPCGIDRAEIRRRNFIRPDQLPWTNQVGMVIHSGEFENTMNMALERADWAGFETRRQEAKARGRLRGIGLGCYIEASGGQPTEQATVRMTPEGRAPLKIGRAACRAGVGQDGEHSVVAVSLKKKQNN